MTSDINSFQELTSKLEEVPTLPTVITKITQLMRNPRTSASEVGQAITTDQSLASKTLKLVNSAFYGFPGRINTITHAIVILGFNTVKNIVLTTSIFNTLGTKGGQSGFNVNEFWLHSVATGAVARVLAGIKYKKLVEEAFIGGLLHDLGKVVLSHFAKDEFKLILEHRDEKDCLLKDAEMAVIELTHQEIGGWLGEKWNLPKDLTAVIQYHHSPPLAGPYENLASIVHLADIIARSLGHGSGGDNGVPEVQTEVWNLLQIEKMDWPNILEKAEEEIDKASVFLQVF